MSIDDVEIAYLPGMPVAGKPAGWAIRDVWSGAYRTCRPLGATTAWSRLPEEARRWPTPGAAAAEIVTAIETDSQEARK